MKPSIPKGTRDFGPLDSAKRDYILNTIRKKFRLFGFQPIETPAMENIETLTGKYGEEGDQLIFKILNSRLHESKSKELLREKFEESLQTSLNTPQLTEKALRYDLTVPFARYVVMHRNEITFPFKRYQIQPVWRADKPQKGRYREFYQCDADIIGSNSLLNELDLILLIDTCFQELKIPVTLKINNRKILSAIAQASGQPDKLIDITVAIDKLDKVGKEAVINELLEKGLSQQSIDIINPIIDFTGSNEEKLAVLKNTLGGTETADSGIRELSYLLEGSKKLNLNHIKLELDITLARGLNYYTGTIFEAKADTGNFSPSILGGGRYDDLTGIFGLNDMSGVGISFGIDRIWDVMNELLLFPENLKQEHVVQVLFANFGEEEAAYCLLLINKLRNAGISCELYPDTKKIQKQMEYANKRGIPFVCLVGSNEIKNNQFLLKDMLTGTQETLDINTLLNKLNSLK